MKKTWLNWSLGLGLLGVFVPTMATAEVDFQEQFSSISYLPKDILPIKKVAISAVNVKVGVHLERLTLLSGEGNTDKKITAGLIAGAMTILGGSGGMDFAEKEPLQEHLPPADAQRIADEIGTMLKDAVNQSGLELVAPETVTATPGYAAVEGETKITTDTEKIKGGMFRPDYFFGYQQVPVLGYKFLNKSASFFGVPSNAAATRVREVAAVPLTLAWSVALVNDRKVMRVRKLSLSFWGQSNGSGEDMQWASIELAPDSLSVPSGESHKNLEYWAAMAPSFADTVKTMVKRAADKFAAAGG